MNLTADQSILPGKTWPRGLKLGLAILALPMIAYLPGFFMGVSQGIATSLPFWAQAKDYTCSSGTVESLMVRVSPFVDPRTAKARGDAWDCKRIAILSDADLGRAGSLDPDAEAWYVRIYTPAMRPELGRLASASAQGELLTLQPAARGPTQTVAAAPEAAQTKKR